MEGTIKNEISIDCKDFGETKKRKVQEALFTLGYEWLGFGKKFMYKHARILVGRSIDCEHHKGKILMWSGVPDLEFEASMVTFDELMGMAGIKKEEDMIEKIYYIDLLGFSNSAKAKALEAMVDHSKKTGLAVESFKSSNSPDFCGKPEITACNCRYYIIGRHSICCANTLGYIYGPSLSRLGLYQWVEMFGKKDKESENDPTKTDRTKPRQQIRSRDFAGRIC